MTENENTNGIEWHEMSVGDLLDYTPPELVKIEGESIGFRDCGNWGYWIELDRINTPRDLLEWVHHMTGKSWVTNQAIDQFIEKVFSYRGWTLYKGV